METTEILLKCLKSKHIIQDVEKAKKETTVEHIVLKRPEDLFVRDAITGMGTILKEDLENHYYITSVKTGTFGNVLTYAIIKRFDETNEADEDTREAKIGVYAHEGLIKQHLAEKTLNSLKAVLSVV